LVRAEVRIRETSLEKAASTRDASSPLHPILSDNLSWMNYGKFDAISLEDSAERFRKQIYAKIIGLVSLFPTSEECAE